MADEWSDLRPFVSDGHPMDCKVMIIGINPASKMDYHFECYWEDNSGFNKEIWSKHYILSREDRKPSKTRNGIEIINCELNNSKTFETNMYSLATKDVKELKEEFIKRPDLKVRASLPIKWFLKNLPNISAILIHGNNTAKAFKNDFGSTLKRWDFDLSEMVENSIMLESKQRKILFTRHLSRLSYENCKKIGKALKQLSNNS